MQTLSDYEKRILAVWEEVYKKGQLTFWILLSLRKENQHMLSMKKFINEFTNNSLVADDKSMYRALRRLHQMELIQYEEERGSQTGPNRKSYSLTETGENILQTFINRNITGIFFKPEIKGLLQKGAK